MVICHLLRSWQQWEANVWSWLQGWGEESSGCSTKASGLREAGIVVLNFRCSTELLWPFPVREGQGNRNLSHFSLFILFDVSYVALAKSQFWVKETPAYTKQLGKLHAKLNSGMSSSLCSWFFFIWSRDLYWVFKQVQKGICIYTCKRGCN